MLMSNNDAVAFEEWGLRRPTRKRCSYNSRFRASLFEVIVVLVVAPGLSAVFIFELLHSTKVQWTNEHERGIRGE